MQAEQLISLLSITGYIAAAITLLSMVGTVFLAVRFPPGRMRKILAKSEIGSEQEQAAPTPEPPKVVMTIPEDAPRTLKRLWGRTPPMPAGWSSSSNQGGPT